jgi:hypothetical protein
MIWPTPPIRWTPVVEPPPSLQTLTDAAYLLLEGVVEAPQIGIWPGAIRNDDPTDDDLEPMGLVGVPTWFWAEDAGPGVGWPETMTTTVNGFTLRATVSVVKTGWQTGDNGQVVVCGLGSVPRDRHHQAPSPSGCDHTYLERGDYTITATTHVVVEWSGAGRSGSIPITVERSGLYHVGEIQVLAHTVPTSRPT